MTQSGIKYDSDIELISAGLNKFIEQQYQINSTNSLYSYSYRISHTNLVSKVDTLNEHFSDVFYFEKSDDNISFVAADVLQKINIQNSLHRISDFITDLKSKITTNWQKIGLENPPIIIGGVKFDSENSSTEWKNFDANHLFIPKVLILNISNRSYLIFNFFLHNKSNASQRIKEFAHIVDILYSSESNHQSRNNFSVIKDSDTSREKKSWLELVTNTADRLNAKFKKVVVSRRLELQSDGVIDWAECLGNLMNDCPSCYIYLLKSGNSIFFGASPEKFISARGKKIELDALAGSAPINTIKEDSILKSTKNINEHKYVIEFLKDVLSKYAQHIQINDVPKIKKLKDVQHLHSIITAELNQQKDIMNVIVELYPTPAVCGLPKTDALKLIRQKENFDRGLFSGLIGWIDLNMDCEFAVSIRSALNIENKFYLYAGAGIVENSVPEQEYNETEMKFNTILNLFDETEKG